MQFTNDFWKKNLRLIAYKIRKDSEVEIPIKIPY